MTTSYTPNLNALVSCLGPTRKTRSGFQLELSLTCEIGTKLTWRVVNSQAVDFSIIRLLSVLCFLHFVFEFQAQKALSGVASMSFDIGLAFTSWSADGTV